MIDLTTLGSLKQNKTIVKRDVVVLRAKPQKPVLQGQKTKIESTQGSELPSLVPAPANLAVQKHANASR